MPVDFHLEVGLVGQCQWVIVKNSAASEVAADLMAVSVLCQWIIVKNSAASTFPTDVWSAALRRANGSWLCL